MTDILRIIIAVAAIFGLSSCHETIHIHPEPIADEKALLTLRIDNSAPQLGAIIDYTITPAVIIYSDDLPEKAIAHISKAGLGSNADNTQNDRILQRADSLAEAFDQIAPYAPDGNEWSLQLKYEVYAGSIEAVKNGLTAPIHSHSATFRADARQPEHDVEMELPFGYVTVIAVAQYVPKGTSGDWFFRTTPLYNVVSEIDKRQGEHDNLYRDCFIVGQEFYVEPTGIDGNVQHLTATLWRPQGRYMVIADDYETYLNIGGMQLSEAYSHIHYPSYINVAYSVLTQMPIASSYDFGYDVTPSLTYVDESPYVRLGDDWSFVNGERSNFNVNITVKEKNDNRVINDNPNTLVPIFPGRVTLVVGHWLTEEQKGGGGIVIDPNFTNEIVIHF